MKRDDLPADAKAFAEAGERALKEGRPLDALDFATEGLKHWQKDVRLRQIQGLALARCGAAEQANGILGELAMEGHRDEETLGMLARTHKDFGYAAADPVNRRHHFRKAHETYADAYKATGGYWTGINAASLATLLGEMETAASLARAVREQCLPKLNGARDELYWLLATLGEAELNLGNWSEAERWYREAADASQYRFGDRSSSRRQARLLLQHLGRDSLWIDELLRVPKVAVFVGHMCDQPGRLRPRFPAQLEPSVREAIRDRLKRHYAHVGFSSAACGSDILFVETLLDLQGEPCVVLPYEKGQFACDSVDIVPGWKQRYEAVIGQLVSTDRNVGRVIEVAQGQMEQQTVSYDYANLVLLGLALRRAKELDSELICLAVWDGRPGDGPGGTWSAVERWRTRGHEVDWIDLDKMLHKECPELIGTDGPSTASGHAVVSTPPSPEVKVLAMLFADVVGFSKFTEKQAVNFTRHGLGAICKLLLDWPREAIVRESRGDGVYLAFETVRDAGLFALDLHDLIKKAPWPAKNLPADLKLRIGLHAGPVCRCFDPILGAQTWTGAHVARAARIEPVTPPGQVFASREFAAFAQLENVTEFTCDYVETKELPKHYGTLPLYAVRRRPR